MKAKLLLTIVAVLSLSFSSIAGNADLFNYDKSALDIEFAEIQELENFVLSNEGMDINGFAQSNNLLLESIDLASLQCSSPLGAMFSIDDMDWGSFAWGFCCCPVGFFVVAISDEKSSDQKTSFWVGVIVSAVLSSLGGGYSASTTTI